MTCFFPFRTTLTVNPHDTAASLHWNVFHRLNHSAAERPEDNQQKLMYVQNSNATKKKTKCAHCPADARLNQTFSSCLTHTPLHFKYFWFFTASAARRPPENWETAYSGRTQIQHAWWKMNVTKNCRNKTQLDFDRTRRQNALNLATWCCDEPSRMIFTARGARWNPKVVPKWYNMVPKWYLYSNKFTKTVPKWYEYSWKTYQNGTKMRPWFWRTRSPWQYI